MTDNKLENDEITTSALTTDDVPEGKVNLYLSTTGGKTDNLEDMPNFNAVSTSLSTHLTNTNNPHSDILSGLRTHQTQITLASNIVLSPTQYIDCLLVQGSNTTDYTITIPNDSSGPQFATNAAFTAFRMGSANLTVQCAAGVSFTNASGTSITLPNPQTSYFLFIRQRTNQWAVVTYGASNSFTTLQQAYDNGNGIITLASSGTKPLTVAGNNSGIASFDLNKGVIFPVNSPFTVVSINANGEQAHPPQIMLTATVTLTSGNIDSVFINSASVNTAVQLQDETLPNSAYPPNATFDAWALNSAQMQVIAPANVTIIGYGSGATITIPQGGYFSFRRQSQNTWAIAWAIAGPQVITSWNGSPLPVAVTAGPGITITNGVISALAASSVVTTLITSNTTMTAAAAINIFVMQNTSFVTLTLPASFTAGQVFKVVGGANTAAFSIAINNGQSVNVISNEMATTATTALNIDTLADSMELVAVTSTQLTLTSCNSPDINFN